MPHDHFVVGRGDGRLDRTLVGDAFQGLFALDQLQVELKRLEEAQIDKVSSYHAYIIAPKQKVERILLIN